MAKKLMMMAFAAVAAVFGAWADTWTDPDTGYTWTYRVHGYVVEIYNKGTAAVSWLRTGYLAIPAVIGGKTVTSIGNGAFMHCGELTSVRIPNCVTSIGDRAFEGCRGLTSVTIPNSVISIGDSAFRDCSSLTSVTIPDGVTSIGDRAFDGCTGLTSVTIPQYVCSFGLSTTFSSACQSIINVVILDSVTSIGNNAFSDCRGLTSVTIPNSVTSIGGWAFNGCSGLMSIDVGSGNLAYSSTNGLLLTKDGKTLVQGVNGDVTIPDGVNSIGCAAFSGCTNLASVTIPNSVTSIGDYAFFNCSGLTSLSIPESVTNIGVYAFSGCNGLISMTIPDSAIRIGDYVFSDCSGLTSVMIPNSVTSIGQYAFANCSGLTSISLPESVTSIGAYAFSGCDGLTSMTIPDSVTSIGDCAFYGANNLQELTIPAALLDRTVRFVSGYRINYDVWVVGSDGDNHRKIEYEHSYIYGLACLFSRGIFSESRNELYNLRVCDEDGHFVHSVDLYKRDGDVPPSLANVVINAGTEIPELAFAGCSRLTSVTISDSVTSIGERAFDNCIGLTSVTIPDSVTSIGYWAFCGCSGLTSVTIPDSVTSIKARAFEGCSGITSVTIPQCVCASQLSTVFHSAYQSIREVIVTDGVTSLGDGLFSGCTMLNSVTIPDSVTTIGVSAFCGCRGLTSVTIPDSVTSLGREAFSGCSGLTGVTIPDSVTSIGYCAFLGCSGLKSATIPQCVCASQLSAVFPSAYRSIREVVVSKGVTSLGDGLFSGCTMLNSITIPESVTTIGASAFYNCSGLTCVTIPDSVVNIGDNAFKGCNGLSKATIPNVVCASTISTVFPSAYQSIREVVLPDRVTGLGEGLFSGCRMLSSVIIPKDVVSIGDFAFSDCSKLEGVEIPYGVKNFGAHAFAGCVALEDVTIPYSIKQLGDYAFSGCSSLHRIVLPGWLRGTFDESTFSGNADDFEIVYIDGVGICVNASDMGFSEGEHCLWYGDRDVSHDGIASARLKGMGQDSESSIELYLGSPGRLSFWWKASSESDGVNVFDYAYLSIDGVPQGTLNKESYRLNGVAIGGKTGWRHKVIDVVGKGSHVIRWTYAKDEIDEGDTGDDCVWLDEVEFTPLAYLSFDIAGGTGMVPAEISELEGTVVTLPAQSGFEWEDHVFNGWSDGKAIYAAESQYVVPATNVTLTAQWIANRFLTFALDGGDGQIPIAIKDVPGAEIKLPSANGISRAKHVFVGWSDGATTYDAGANYRVTDASVEFKAVWQRKEAHVSIVSDDVVNGGTVDTAGVTISMSAWSNPSVGTPAIYYTLDGTEPTTGSTRYEEPFFVDVLGDVTVRALAVLDDCFEGKATFSFTRLPYSLCECVAMEGVSVAVGGAAPWFRVTGEGAHDGKAALRSGAIGDGESSCVEMQVRGEAEVSFWWKISSQNKVRTDKHDYLAFSVDGEDVLTLGGGVIDWTNATYAVTGDGRHSLRWTYIKDGTNASNEDCAWLDDVVWSPTGKLCAVSFDANGGEVSECERKVREGSSVGDLPKPQRYCYDFDGWFTAADGGDAISSETEVADNVTYYAHWKVSQYTVVFDENGGTGGMTVVQDYGTALSAPMVSRKGYTFTGWSPAVPATVPAGGATYMAQWKVNQYAVAFDANGGEGSITNQQDYASEIVPPEVSRTGYTFAGWLPEVEASVPASNVVYTAQWTANKYTVSFDANGVDGGGIGRKIWYVNGSSGSDSNSGTSQLSAKATIQTAIDDASDGDTILVAPGTYAPITTGNKAVTIQSTAGAASTIIDGNGKSPCTVLCESMENKATHSTILIGFTLQNGYVSGIWQGGAGTGGTFRNCVICDNVGNGYGAAGGCVASVVQNCLVCRNRYSSGGWGGGALANCSDVFNCTIVDNAGYGVWDGEQRNCIIYGNTHDVYVSRGNEGHNNYCMTESFIASGVGNKAGNPNFVDAANGDYRLAASSPCIDAGDNSHVAGDADLDGNARIVSGAVDIGCYEYGSTATGVSLPTGELIVELACGAELGALPTPTREGYSFDGWYTAASGGTKINASTKVTGDATYYAHWTVNQYTVTFNANGGNGGKTVTQDFGAAIAAPTVTRTGYTFTGWSPAVPATVPAGNATYVAQWTINKYTVTFDANGGTGGAGVPADGLWAYYPLDGNANDASGNGRDLTAVKNDPQPTTDRFGNANGAYVFNGSSAQNIEQYAEDRDEQRAQSIIGSFSFGFWFQTNSSYLDYGAGWAWNLGNYAVYPMHGGVYNDERGQASGLGVKVGVDGIEIVEHADGYMPTKLTYQTNIGSGWHHVAVTVEDSGCPLLYLDGTYVATGETSDRTRLFRLVIGGSDWGYYTGKVDDLVVYNRALSAAEVKTLYEGGDGVAMSIEYGEAIGNLPSPSRAGYSLDGWFTSAAGGTRIAGSTKVTGNVTYYAHWKTNQYTVKFDANGGSGGKTVTQDYGTALSAPTVTRTGYTFTGWSPAVPATVPAGNATYVAQWTKNKYTVTFNANGGVGGWSKSMDYGAAIAVPTVTRTGYTFSGWSSAVAKTVPIGGASYTAQWTINRHHVTLSLNGGDGIGSATVDYGTRVGDLPVPTREGCEFLGWFTAPTGGSRAADNAIVTGDMTLYAQWHIVLPELYEMIDGAAPDMAASEYNGYLHDAKSGAVKGTIQVKVGKPGKKDGKASVKATVVVGTKKVSLKGADKGKAVIAADGPTEIDLVGKGAEACTVTLGADGISGYYGPYLVDGSRNFFASKDKGEVADANAAISKWLGSLMVVWKGGSLSVSIAAKGKVKVSGTLADGRTKVSVSTVLLVGEEWCCASVAAPKANLSFVIWLSRDGKTARVEGLGDDVLVGSAGTLVDGAKFRIDAAEFAAAFGQSVLPYLPDGVPVTKSGTKWTLPKAGKITMKKGVVDGSKAGDNPSGLKLTYKAKDGTFKGSFKVYSVNKGKLKSTTVNVTGFLLDGIGYGTATVKGKDSVEVTIE